MKCRLILIGLLLCGLFGTTFAQQVKKVAILEVVDRMNGVDYGPKMLLRQNLANAINKTDGYDAYTRIDMKAIFGEQDFQRSGNVNDAQIRKIGQMTGAQYVLVAEAAKYSSSELVVAANLIDIESGQIKNSTEGEIVNHSDKEAMKNSIYSIIEQLLDVTVNDRMPERGMVRPSRQPSKSSFTETAFGINMRMVWVEGGDFLMGCTSEQGSDCDSDEKNVRRVTVDGFYIGMLEVTQSQWEKLMGTSVYQQRDKANTQWPMRGVGPDYPMYYVSWEEAMEFCRALSQKTGRTYTLPTEAQWEYAARGGNKPDGTKYAGGNVVDAVAWYTDNSGGSTHVCGTKRANALGIYDMSGNVYEWCKDWYGDSYISYDVNNPQGASSGSARVLRGGSWRINASYCRVAYRYSVTPGYRNGYSGFRVVMIP